MLEIFTVFSEFKEFRSYFGIFFPCFNFCFVFVSVFSCHTHLSTSSSWQTEVQDKTLLAWSWHIVCTVESLDLLMVDDHPPPWHLWAGWNSHVGRENGKLHFSVAFLGEGGTEQDALGSYPLPSHLWLGSALALPAGSPLVFCAGAPPPEPLYRNCQLFLLSSQWQNGFHWHLDLGDLFSFSFSSIFGHLCPDSLTAVTWLWLLRFPPSCPLAPSHLPHPCSPPHTSPAWNGFTTCPDL